MDRGLEFCLHSETHKRQMYFSVMTAMTTVDSEIDVEELTKRIKDQVERMRRAENFKSLQDEFSSDRAGAMTKAREFISTPERVSVAADDLANVAAVLSPRNLGTGKRIIAPFVMRLHRLADTEVRWLMEPTIMRQTKFNLQLVNLFRELESDVLPALRDLERFEEEIQNTRSRVSEIEDTLKNSRVEYSEIHSQITARLSNIEKSMQDIETKAQLIARKRREDMFIQYPISIEGEKIVVNERVVENPFVLSNLPQRAKRILDVGCTEGYLAIQLASLGFSVYGIDVRNYVLSHPNFHFVRDDITNTPFPNEYFDVVLALSSIEHVGLGHYGDPMHGQGDFRAIKEIYRVLKKGGTLIMSVPIGLTATKTWERIYDDESLKQLLADFTIERMAYWIKKNEQWVSATPEDVKKLKVDIGSLGAYPLWPSIAALVAKKIPVDTRR